MYKEMCLGVIILFVLFLTGCTTKLDKNIEVPECTRISYGTVIDHSEIDRLQPTMTYVYLDTNLLYAESMGYKYFFEEDGIVVVKENDSIGYYVETQKTFLDIDAEEMFDYIEGIRARKIFYFSGWIYKSDDYEFIVKNPNKDYMSFLITFNKGDFSGYSFDVSRGREEHCKLEEFDVSTEQQMKLYNNLDYMFIEDDNTLLGTKHEASIKFTLDPLEFIVKDDTTQYKYKFLTNQVCILNNDNYLCDDAYPILRQEANPDAGKIYKFDFVDRYSYEFFYELYDVLLQYYFLMYDHDYSE